MSLSLTEDVAGMLMPTALLWYWYVLSPLYDVLDHVECSSSRYRSEKLSIRPKSQAILRVSGFQPATTTTSKQLARLPNCPDILLDGLRICLATFSLFAVAEQTLCRNGRIIDFLEMFIFRMMGMVQHRMVVIFAEQSDYSWKSECLESWSNVESITMIDAKI